MDKNTEIPNEQLQHQRAAPISQLSAAALGTQQTLTINQPQIAIPPVVATLPLATASLPTAVSAGQTGIVSGANPYIPSTLNPSAVNSVMNPSALLNPMQHFTPPFNIPPTLAPAAQTTATTIWPNAVLGAMQNMDPVRQALIMMIDPEIRNAAAEWQEYKSQDGKPYYFSLKTTQSVWDKPKALIDFEDAIAQAKSEQEEISSKTGQANKNGEVRSEEKTDEQPKALNPANIPLFGSQPYAHPFNVPPNIALTTTGQPAMWPNAVMGAIPNMDPTRQALLMLVEPEVKLSAAEWTEYRAPDGKPYYFSQKTRQSVWEKPKALMDLEEALVRAKAKQEEMKVKASEMSKNGEVRTEGKSEDRSKSEKIEENSGEKPMEQVRDKSKPISSTPVSGTPWCVVWTGDHKVFFYNPSTKTSVWERPTELKNRPEVDKLLKGPPRSDDEASSPPPEKRSAEVEPDKSAKKQKKVEEESEKENKKDPTTDLQILAAKQRETIPLEERTQMFRNMLIEKEVSAFSTWEKELQKIVFDPRYLLLTSKERRQVFDKYVKEKAEEERKEKRQRLKQQRENFRKLLEEAVTNYKTTYNEFAQKYCKDDRFRNIDKSKDRETLFSDFISELRRKDKEEKATQREKAKEGFLALLKEQTFLDRHSRWSETKEKIRDDPRYKALDSSSAREDAFRSYLSTLLSRKSEASNEVKEDTDANDSSSKEREKLKEKEERIEASLREREKEVARELSTHFRERDKEREQHKHAEAVEHFNALLTDLVRNPDISWREAKKTLKKDHRWEMIATLDRDEKEKLFNEHIDNLYKKKREKFRELLDETKELTLTSSWRDIRRYIKDDPRYTKFSSSNRKCEREFREYMKDKLTQAKNQFRELLKETKIITFKSKKMIEDSEQHLQDIIAVLQNDKRYLVLDCIEDERRNLLMSYIEESDRKGPPPPPTASEPARRPIK